MAEPRIVRRPLNLTVEERRERKRRYDKARRAKEGANLKRQTKEWYRRNHDEQLRKQAQKRAEIRADPGRFAEWQRYSKEHRSRPEWKAHKRKYDRRYRVVRDYGPDFGEAVVVLLELNDELATTNEEKAARRFASGRANKAQTRRRAWKRTKN